MFMYWFSRLDKKEKSNDKSEKIKDKCFQYMVTFGLKYEVIKWNLERVSNIKSFTNKYKWKIINYQD